MNVNLNSSESFNELVFENRNKEYGAYVIRKSYNDNMTLSLFLASGFFGFLALAAVLFSNGKEPVVKSMAALKIDSLVSVIIDIKPPVVPDIPDKPARTAPPKSNSNDYEPTDKPVDNPDPTLPLVKNGDPKGVIVDTASTHAPIVFKLPTPPIDPGLPRAWVDEMPDFAGGITQYVASNLVYPRVAVEDFRSGTVYLTFVVETDGSVSNVKVLKGIGDGCEEEAMRVIKGMPKWKPGKNNGQPVRVQFNLPVKFSIK